MLRDVALPAACVAAVVAAFHLGRRAGASKARKEHECEALRGSGSADTSEKRAVKAALLQNLAHHTYVKLAPSSLHGVGVFAVVDIPPGIDPFNAPNAHLRGEELSIPVRESTLVAACPAPVVEYVLEFCAAMDAEDCIAEAMAEAADAGEPASVSSAPEASPPVYYGINATGLVTMDTSW